MRCRSAPLTAAWTFSMSFGLQRARPQMTGPEILVGDRLHGLEVAGRGGRKAGLDDVDLQIGQRLRDPQLFAQRHAAARGLLAVAQRRVENANCARAVISCFLTGDLQVDWRTILPASPCGRAAPRRLSRSGVRGPPSSCCLYSGMPASFSAIQLRANVPSWMSSSTAFICSRECCVDDARAADHVAVCGRVADELVHLAQAALVQQVDDELQLVHDFVIGDFRLIARLRPASRSRRRSARSRRRRARPARRTGPSRFPRRRSSR